MGVVGVLLESRAGMLALRRSLPRSGASRVRLLRCRSLAALRRLLETRLVEAVVLAPQPHLLPELAALRAQLPALPLVAYAAFRPDDGELLLACRRHAVTAVAVEGVDDAVVGDVVRRHSLAAARRTALGRAPVLLRLTDPLQRAAWDLLLNDVEHPLRTAALARQLRVSREHLSRQFGAGGAPNIKRVIDLTRVIAAAQLLANPGYEVSSVVRILHFTSPAHLGRTTRRIAGVSPAELGTLDLAEVLARFLRGHTRSRC